MANEDPFVDFYSILRVSPNSDAKALTNAYHELAKKYHPDHAEAADVTKLTEVIEAYNALRDADQRAEYDAVYSGATGFIFTSEDEVVGDAKSAISDADAHAKVLLLLYKRRREQAQDPGIGRYHVHQMLGCSEELFEFHIWYLREKGFIRTSERGTLEITIEGVDHVIATSRITLKEKLLLAQPSEMPEPPR
jgi:curved DNA-binding protein